MIRRIYCQSCGNNAKSNDQDTLEGWKYRKHLFFAKKPEIHEVEVSTAKKTTKYTLPSLLCDLCGCEIPDGSKVYGITMWKTGDPGNWEKEFGG